MTARGAAPAVGRWERQRGLARLVRLVVFLAPAVVATDVGILAARLLPEPHQPGTTILWWAVVIGTSVAALVAFDRLFRRLLPLTVLLELALVFPGAAPSRFAASFRGGTVRNLQRRIDQAKTDADGADETQAAATVVELIAALAVHDPRTRGHCERTRAYSELIAEEMGLAPTDRERLRWSALLHDIGKLHVTPALLNKAGKPDPQEWESLRAHPMEGARVAGALRGWLGPWGLAIEQHHERFDGTGYPLGLAGEDISLGGRIVSVADAFEVMTSTRSYSKPVSPEAAREELVRCAGGHFDPEVVRAFLRISLARLPRFAGLFVTLAQVPGFLAAQRVLERAGSVVAAGAAVVVLAAGGVISPSPAGDPVGPPVAEGDGGGGSARSGAGSGPGSTGGGASGVAAGGGAGANERRPATADASAVADAPSLPAIDVPVLPPGSGAAVGAGATPTTAPSAPASSTTSTTTIRSSTTAPPTRPSGYFLGGAAPGAAASPAALQADRPGGSGAPDHDGDGAAGRTLRPSPQPATTTAPEEHQLWAGRFQETVTITGTPVLMIPSAVAGFGAGRGNLRAYLLDCDAEGGTCLAQPIATAALNEAEWGDGGGGFTTKTLTFGAVDHTLAAGRTLVLRLGVQQGSAALVVAYGTADHAAFLELDAR